MKPIFKTCSVAILLTCGVVHAASIDILDFKPGMSVSEVQKLIPSLGKSEKISESRYVEKAQQTDKVGELQYCNGEEVALRESERPPQIQSGSRFISVYKGCDSSKINFSFTKEGKLYSVVRSVNYKDGAGRDKILTAINSKYGVAPKSKPSDRVGEWRYEKTGALTDKRQCSVDFIGGDKLSANTGSESCGVTLKYQLAPDMQGVISGFQIGFMDYAIFNAFQLAERNERMNGMQDQRNNSIANTKAPKM